MIKIKKYCSLFAKRFISFMKLSYKRKLLIVISFLLTGIIRFSILFIPFKKLASIMGQKMADSSFDVDSVSKNKALVVGEVVRKVSGITPWQSKCLVQALTAQIILRLMKIPTTLYLGVCKNEGNQLEAHAWLRHGKIAITGGNQMTRFKEIMRFAAVIKKDNKAIS